MRLLTVIDSDVRYLRSRTAFKSAKMAAVGLLFARIVARQASGPAKDRFSQLLGQVTHCDFKVGL